VVAADGIVSVVGVGAGVGDGVGAGVGVGVVGVGVGVTDGVVDPDDAGVPVDTFAAGEATVLAVLAGVVEPPPQAASEAAAMSGTSALYQFFRKLPPIELQSRDEVADLRSSYSQIYREARLRPIGERPQFGFIPTKVGLRKDSDGSKDLT
jgi:hypothetical protein